MSAACVREIYSYVDDGLEGREWKREATLEGTRTKLVQLDNKLKFQFSRQKYTLPGVEK